MLVFHVEGPGATSLQCKVVGVVSSVTRSHCNGYKSAKSADIVAASRYCGIRLRYSGRSAAFYM
jgi:hypothetical protein